MLAGNNEGAWFGLPEGFGPPGGLVQRIYALPRSPTAICVCVSGTPRTASQANRACPCLFMALHPTA